MFDRDENNNEQEISFGNKGLEYDLFEAKRWKGEEADEDDNPPPTIHDDISYHVKWIYHHIYKHPYNGLDSHEEFRDTGIARSKHGIAHVTRAAFYSSALLGLYQRHRDADALKLTSDEDLKLLKIALLFHDRERERVTAMTNGMMKALYFYIFILSTY